MFEGFAVALPALGLLYVINKRLKVKGKALKTVVAVLTMVTAFAVGCGIAFTFLGQWVARGVAWLESFTGFGRGVAVALTIVAVGIALADVLSDRKADRGAQFAAILAPTLLLLVAGGFLGTTGGGAVTTSYDHFNAIVASFGG